MLCGAMDSPAKSSDSDDTALLGAVAGLGGLAVIFLGLVCYMRSREVSGNPLFSPLVARTNP